MKKLLIIAGFLAVVATPVYAQQGAGNVHKIAHASGNSAYAMAPAASANVDPYSPALNGGGSAGYNQLMATEQ